VIVNHLLRRRVRHRHLIRRKLLERDIVIVTVVYEVPTDAEELGLFADPAAAIDCAQAEVRRLNASGAATECVDPPEDLVRTG
jgi:hypothetical protein